MRLPWDIKEVAMDVLEERQETIVPQIEQEEDDGDSAYTFTSGSALAAWLKYDQYRKRLLLDKIYPYIVTTDITNFFDTIMYDRVADGLHSIRVDCNLVGLLFFVLERLSIHDAFNESPPVIAPGHSHTWCCSRTTIEWLSMLEKVPTFAGWTIRISG